MKKLSLLLLLTAVFCLGAAAKGLNLTTLRFSVTPPLTTQSAAKLQKQLRGEGVSRVIASPELQVVSVTFNQDKTSPEALLKMFKNAGFEATRLTDELLKPDASQASQASNRFNSQPGTAPVKIGENSEESSSEATTETDPDNPRGWQNRGQQSKNGNAEGRSREKLIPLPPNRATK